VKTIKVSDQLHEDLVKIRDEEGHTSLDSTIRTLKLKSGYDE
jgi:predicted CopG family antitoxin